MTLEEIIRAIEEYMDASLPVNGMVADKAKQALEALRNDYDWTPVYDGDGKLPPVDEDGYSEKIMISFANSTLPEIGEYRQDEDGDGSFYIGDMPEKFSDFGLVVNGWRPLPKSYREDEQEE